MSPCRLLNQTKSKRDEGNSTSNNYKDKEEDGDALYPNQPTLKRSKPPLQFTNHVDNSTHLDAHEQNVKDDLFYGQTTVRMKFKVQSRVSNSYSIYELYAIFYNNDTVQS